MTNQGFDPSQRRQCSVRGDRAASRAGAGKSGPRDGKAVLVRRSRIGSSRRQSACPICSGLTSLSTSARTDNKQPFADVQVSGAAQARENGPTDAGGWIILRTERRAHMSRTYAAAPLSKFRRGMAEKRHSAACGTEILEFEVDPPPKVGRRLSFHPVLFVKARVSASKDEFTVLTTSESALSSCLRTAIGASSGSTRELDNAGSWRDGNSPGNCGRHLR